MTLDFLEDFRTLIDTERAGDFCYIVDLRRTASLR